MVVASQRPAKLSQTILSQCNTFLLHRITNDVDQDAMKRLVPDSLKDLFNALPVLPTQQAIFTGWATELPVRVQMRNLRKDQRPDSEDPGFWPVWTENRSRDINLEAIAKEFAKQ